MYVTTSSELPSFTKDALPLENSSLFPATFADVRKTIKRWKPFKFVGLDDSPGIFFIIKGYTNIFVLLITYIFNFVGRVAQSA